MSTATAEEVPPGMITMREAEARHGVSYEFLRYLKEMGRLPHVTLGRPGLRRSYLHEADVLEVKRHAPTAEQRAFGLYNAAIAAHLGWDKSKSVPKCPSHPRCPELRVGRCENYRRDVIPLFKAWYAEHVKARKSP